MPQTTSKIPVNKKIHLGSGALSGKLLLVRNVENNVIRDYFRAG